MSIVTAGARIRAGIERALNAGRHGEAEMLAATVEGALGLLESLADIADGIGDGHATIAPAESTIDTTVIPTITDALADHYAAQTVVRRRNQ